MKRYIVGLGEALWDVLPEGKKLGGAPANFAYQLPDASCALSDRNGAGDADRRGHPNV